MGVDLIIKAVGDTSLRQRPVCQLSKGRLVLGGDLAAEGYLIVLDHALDGDTGIRVVLQAIRHNGIRNLVAELVGVARRNLLRGKEHLESPLSALGKWKRSGMFSRP